MFSSFNKFFGFVSTSSSRNSPMRGVELGSLFVLLLCEFRPFIESNWAYSVGRLSWAAPRALTLEELERRQQVGDNWAEVQNYICGSDGTGKLATQTRNKTTWNMIADGGMDGFIERTQDTNLLWSSARLISHPQHRPLCKG